MKTLLRSFLIVTLLFPIISQADNAQDLINFQNEDTLHGHFKGITSKGKIIWNYEPADGNLGISTDSIRRIALNKKNFSQPIAHTSSITLTNGDLIFGKILSFDDTTLELHTEYAGKLSFPRQHIAHVHFDGSSKGIFYRGPFNTDTWEHTSQLGEHNTDEDFTPEWTPYDIEKKAPKQWKHKNFSWVIGEKNTAIRLNQELSGNYRITMKIKGYTQSRLHLVFCADFDSKKLDLKSTKNSQTRLHARRIQSFGSFVTIPISIKNPSNVNYISLYTINDEGFPVFQHIQNTLRMRNLLKVSSNENYYDIRVNRDEGTIFVYVNGHLLSQWKLKNQLETLKGNKIGFFSYAENYHEKTEISDLQISYWNGVTDSAASLENKFSDIIMLTNGTDRISSSHSNFKNNQLKIQSTYGELSIPAEEIDTLSFATKDRKDFTTPTTSITFQNGSKLSGVLSRGEGRMMKFEHPLTGIIDIDPKYISTIDFVDILSPYTIIKDDN